MSDPAHPHVLHLDDGRQWRGGQHQVFLLAQGLARRGIAQEVMVRPEAPLAAKLREAGIATAPLHFRGEWDWSAPRSLAIYAAERGMNILHAHTAHMHALGLRAHRRLRSSGGGGKIHLLSTRRVDFPVGRGFFSRRKYTDPMQYFIAISSAIRDVLRQGGVEAGRITLVHSGVPPIPAEAWSRERVRDEFRIGKDEIAILNIGALTDHKGQRWLIEAAPLIAREFPSARIHIFGEGELRGELESLCASLRITDRVIFHGHIPEARIKLAGFDLYVSSSHLEGLGTSVLDAMLAGLPVAACRAGGITDVIEDESTGILCAPKDP
ncbi:glycosyltransferase, partial [Candidatus Sumerlaeota bacterium]|nr:glycosyltransferase [Candidatus Sumerlaeota bacterium]